jgi:AraC family transcriptional regulator of adaptative response/methylated-DNA-[protein]-cysteine methyltransferase
VVPSLFGDLLVAITYDGLCGMAFCSHYGVQLTLETLSKKWEGKLIQINDDILEFSKKIFSGSDTIPVHLLGTNFQVDVWRSLMKIPYANLETYSFIATDVGHKLAVRAVASAIGSNPISWLIPCHRVISKSFHLSGYNWGIHQKASLLAHEFQVTAQRFFELQYCCLKRSCELKKIKYGELEARGS